MTRNAWKTIQLFIKWSGIAIVVYFITDMLKVLAQEQVLKFNVLIETLVKISGSFYISITITISSAVYGLRQRYLRRKNTKHLTKRIDYLEKQAWPNKTSLGINEDGTTRSEDK